MRGQERRCERAGETILPPHAEPVSEHDDADRQRQHGEPRVEQHPHGRVGVEGDLGCGEERRSRQVQQRRVVFEEIAVRHQAFRGAPRGMHVLELIDVERAVIQQPELRGQGRRSQRERAAGDGAVRRNPHAADVTAAVRIGDIVAVPHEKRSQP